MPTQLYDDGQLVWEQNVGKKQHGVIRNSSPRSGRRVVGAGRRNHYSGLGHKTVGRHVATAFQRAPSHGSMPTTSKVATGRSRSRSASPAPRRSTQRGHTFAAAAAAAAENASWRVDKTAACGGQAKHVLPERRSAPIRLPPGSALLRADSSASLTTNVAVEAKSGDGGSGDDNLASSNSDSLPGPRRHRQLLVQQQQRRVRPAASQYEKHRASKRTAVTGAAGTERNATPPITINTVTTSSSTAATKAAGSRSGVTSDRGQEKVHGISSTETTAVVSNGRESLAPRTAPPLTREKSTPNSYEKLEVAAAATEVSDAASVAGMHTSSPTRKMTTSLSIADLASDAAEIGGRNRDGRRDTIGGGELHGGGKGRGRRCGVSVGDVATRRSSVSSTPTASAPNSVSDSPVLEELARKERQWIRERALLLDVIRLQHKQLSRSLSDTATASRGTTPTPTPSTAAAPAPIISTTGHAATTHAPRATATLATTRTGTAQSTHPLQPPQPTSQPLTTTALSMVADNHDAAGLTVAGEERAKTSAATTESPAGTSNISTSNEDSWSTASDDEGPFAFSSYERTQLLCKVELQREEAARARSWGSGGSFSNSSSNNNNRGSTTATVSAAIAEVTALTGHSRAAGGSARRRRSSGSSADGSGRGSRRKDAPAQASGQRSWNGIMRLPSGKGDAAVPAVAAAGQLRAVGGAARSLPQRSGVENRLESLEGHIAEVLRRLVALEERAMWPSSRRIPDERPESSTQGLTSGDTST